MVAEFELYWLLVQQARWFFRNWNAWELIAFRVFLEKVSTNLR